LPLELAVFELPPTESLFRKCLKENGLFCLKRSVKEEIVRYPETSRF
jgi:hypothetical protein